MVRDSASSKVGASGPLIIAEVGMNHDGSFGNACRLIDLASECGADVVKFQTHIPEAETLPDAPSPPYFDQELRYEYFRRTAFLPEQWRALKDYSASKHVCFISSAFSKEAVDLLESIGVEAYKIPSGEVTNNPLLETIAATLKPVYLSSGMSTWAELDAAVAVIRRYHSSIVIMQCTSEYPCQLEHVGLNVMLEMKARYELPVGLSDHTMTNYASFAAVASGAEVIEKHLTMSRRVYGSDARHSLEPNEFAELVRGIRDIKTILTSYVDKDDISKVKEMKAVFEKSLVSLRKIPAGTIVTSEMICVKKPGCGIPPRKLGELIGKRATRTIECNTVLVWDDFR